MDIVKFADPPARPAPDGNDIALRQLQGGDASSADFVQIVHATFPPAARLPMAAAPVGKVYVAALGALAIEQADGVRHVLAPGDSAFVAAGEACAVANAGDTPAALVVITPAPIRQRPDPRQATTFEPR